MPVLLRPALAFCLGALLLTGCAPSAEPERRPPNLILILADDLGYGDLGAYGQERIRTPRLDRMAAEGIRFTQFYAGSTVCAPSRSVLMTGQHVGRTHVRGNREIQPMGQEPLPDSVLTVAELLRHAGYRTGLIGKWGLGGPGSSGIPTRQGFDYFFGYLGQRHAHNYYPEFLFFNETRVPLANRLPEPRRPDGAGQAIERVQYSHDLFADSALVFIERHRDEPFFLYLALTIPHANNEAGDEGMEVPDLGPYADRDWPEPAKGAAAMITRMDRDVGRLLDRLTELGLAENTLVLFSSDNGPHREGGHDPDFFDSNGPLRGIKRDLYEGGIRVPAIAWGPGLVPGGGVSDHVAYLGDVMATAADMAGVPLPDTIAFDSISLWPTLTGNPAAQPAHDYLYWEFYERGSAQAVRMGPWKAVRQPMFTGAIELYNLEEDLGETRDVAAAHPDVVAQVEGIMAVAHVPSPLWQPR